MTLETLLVLGLASWCAAHLLVNERGFLAVFERLRRLAGVQQEEQSRTVGSGTNLHSYTVTECRGNNELAKMLCCVYCTGTWTSAAVLALWIIGTGLHLSLAEAVVRWLAIAALCIVCEKVNRYV
jgi:hypothetical protein